MERQPIPQRLRRPLLRDPFVQRDHADSARDPVGEPVPFQCELALIERGAQVRCDPGFQSLCHRDQDHAAVGLREKTPLGHRPPGGQRGRERQAAEQPILGDVQR